jgi:hypothetical protein
MHSTDTNLPDRPDVQSDRNKSQNQSTGATEGILNVSNGVHSTMYTTHGTEE